MSTLFRVTIFLALCKGVAGFGLGGGGFKFRGPPMGPVQLTPVNSSTRWGDIYEDTLQPAVDFCKSARMCNTTGLFSFSDSECSECHPCTCDEACYARRDCCIDKQLRDVSGELVLDSPSDVTPPVFGCHNTYLTHYDLAVHVAMVDTCLKNWSDTEAVDRCLNPAPNETFSHWPVWSADTGTVYRNADCASCNGQVGERVVRWNLKVACDRSVYLGHASHVLQAVEKALEEPTCQILHVPPKGCRPVPCQPIEGHYIDTCNVTGLRQSYDETLWKACEVFHGHMTLEGNTYKNAFCAMCNQEKVRVPGACEVDSPFPFFLEMDGASLRNESTHSVPADRSCGCQESEVYDQFEATCRPLQCSMTRELLNGQCQSIVTNSSGVFYDLTLSLTPADPEDPVQLRGTSPLPRVARNIRTAFLLQGSHTTGWHVMTHMFRVVAQTEEVQSRSLDRESVGSPLLEVIRFKVRIKFCSTWPEPSEALENRLLALMRSEWNFSVDGQRKRAFKASPLYIAAFEKEETENFQHVSLLSSDGRLKEFVVDIPDSHIESHGGDLLETNYYLPLSEALRCARVSFNLSRDAETKKVLLVVNKTSGAVHHLPSDKVISFQFVEEGQDGETLVCADQLFDDGGRDVRTDLPAHFFSSQLLVITVTFQALSVLLLFLVLLTFIVFAELRPVAGKTLLGLVSTLILAMALTGGSMFGVGTSCGCQVLGILGHFFLLSAFTWALICLFHSYHLVTSVSGSRLSRCLNEPHVFPKCTLLAVLVPAVIVVITIVSSAIASRNDCVTDIGYGRGICFVSASNSLISTVCLSMLVIFISVGLTLWAFWERRSMANSSSESCRQQFLQFLARACLSGLMALVWFLQMTALLKDSDTLWYFSVLLYLVLAVYIFLVFLCKKQVLKLWHVWCAASFTCGKGQRHGHKFSPVDT